MPIIQAPHLNTHRHHGLPSGPASSDYSGATLKSKACKAVKRPGSALTQGPAMACAPRFDQSKGRPI